MTSRQTPRSFSRDGISRRRLLQIGALAGFGVTLETLQAAHRLRADQGSGAKDVNCILIWTLGGTSHLDTFDPKPQARTGVKGEFGVISTAVPGVKFAETVPNMARELKRFGLLRGWNPRNASHGQADQWLMSGRPYNPAIAYPTYGSVISYQQGFKTALPPFVQLGSDIDRRFGGGTSGVLGLEHNPLEMVAEIDHWQRQAEIQPAACQALSEHSQAAFNMLTAPETKKAFAIDREGGKLRDAYGRHRFGQSCLLARRLVEAGVRFVTITDGGWDTHENNFKSLRDRRLPPVDQAFPQLLIDLDSRGLLATTLVLWLTDFGRTPTINAAGGRDHCATAGFAIMAGAGVPGGSVLGATNEEGGAVIRDQYGTDDIAATIYHKLGIPTDMVIRSPDGRPVRINEGRVIRPWA